MKHTLPKLGYAYDALEPFIDKETMTLHHTKHHQTYIDKLNAALENNDKLQKLEVEDLIKDLNKIPEAIRGAVRNHGGGHANHSFFWKLLKKNTAPNGDIKEAIEAKYGDLQRFKEEFSKAALGQFGSGWAWLVMHNRELEIMSTPNQDSPLSQGKTPIIGIDVWEHSYYKKYGPNRAGYVEAFFSVLNWDQANKNYNEAVK